VARTQRRTSTLPQRSTALCPVSYLEHTNEDWIRYQLNNGRNVLLNIYDKRLLYACVTSYKNVFGITLQDADAVIFFKDVVVENFCINREKKII